MVMSYIGNQNTHNGLIGKIGEDFACEFLESKGHTIIDRNFRVKMGEIDVVSITKASKSLSQEKIHIVEVKTSQSQFVRPEENMNRKKMLKVAKLGEMYSKNRLFCVDFIGVSLNNDKSLKKITYIENLEIY